MSAPTAVRPQDSTKSWIAGLGQVSTPADENQTPPADAPADDSPDAGKPETPVAPPAEPAAAPATKKADGADKWPRSAQEWKKFKEERDAAFSERDKRIAELESELTTVKSSQPQTTLDPKEFESVKAERDQLSKKLQVVAVTQHPKFEAYFKQKTDAQLALAKRIVGAEDAEAVAKLLLMPDDEIRTQRLEEVVNNLPQVKAIQFGAVLNSIEEIRQERQTEIERAEQSYQEMIANEEKAHKDRRSNLEKAFNDAVAKVQSKDDGLPMFQLRDGDEAWNNDVKKRLDTAKAVLFGQHQTPDTLVNVTLNAMAYQPLLNTLRSAITENGKLKAQIAELTKANPSLEPGRPEGEESAAIRNPTSKPGMRPMDATASWTKGLPQVQGQR